MPGIRWSVAQYLAELERRGASKHTVKNYGSDLGQFAAYFEPPDAAPVWRSARNIRLCWPWQAPSYFWRRSRRADNGCCARILISPVSLP